MILFPMNGLMRRQGLRKLRDSTDRNCAGQNPNLETWIRFKVCAWHWPLQACTSGQPKGDALRLPLM